MKGEVESRMLNLNVEILKMANVNSKNIPKMIKIYM